MLHEILLSLSGHPSPLLRPETLAAHDQSGSGGPAKDGIISLSSTLTPSERALLTGLSRLSELHMRVRDLATRIVTSHPSVVCQAVGAAVQSIHLAAFQKEVLAIENSILRRDPDLVGAYNIVPLTVVTNRFSVWPRRFEWLSTILQPVASEKEACTGAQLMDKMRSEMQTGYRDIADIATSLVRAAEMAWLKQTSAWILYGRLPNVGGSDFFVQQTRDRDDDSAAEYTTVSQYLPRFVTPATAASMLFIGRSLVHVSNRNGASSNIENHNIILTGGNCHLSAQLQDLAKLTYPIDSATFSRTIAHIRSVLSRTTLRRLLPTAKVVEMLQLLRDFFLLGRGEFALALVEQADETIRKRWQRANHLVSSSAVAAQPPTTASGIRGMQAVMVKAGEVSGALAQTWAVLEAMQGQYVKGEDAEEVDEGLELARDMLRLVIQKAEAPASASKEDVANGLSISTTPFRNLLFSVPVSLALQVPYPLDLVFSQADIQAYEAAHSYLLSIRRAHIRLTGLWKLSSLRRHHPPPPGPPYGTKKRGSTSLAHVRMLRQRHAERANTLRSAWVTSSTAIFFLAEVESYLQLEVVAELWDDFQQWLEGEGGDAKDTKNTEEEEEEEEEEDIWLAEENIVDPGKEEAQRHDPQTLATAHQRYLRRVVHGLLLDQTTWTDALYHVLVAMDQLVSLIQRLDSLWTALDLEMDVGVVDAFVDLEQEQEDAVAALRGIEEGVREGVTSAVAVLREIEDHDVDDEDFAAEKDATDERQMEEEEEGDVYRPRCVGGLSRLLMKLDFGSWTAGQQPNEGEAADEDDDVF